jgi:hypothetical protein
VLVQRGLVFYVADTLKDSLKLKVQKWQRLSAVADESIDYPVVIFQV